MDNKLREKIKGRKGEERGGVKKDSASCLFRRKEEGKGRKIPNLTILGEIIFLIKLVYIFAPNPSPSNPFKLGGVNRE